MSNDNSDSEWLEQFDSEITRVSELLDICKPEEALVLLNEIRNKGFEGYFLDISYAETYIILNKWGEASVHIEKAFLTKPEWPWAIFLKAILAKLNNDLDQEIKLMQMVPNKETEATIAIIAVICDIFEINQCWAEFKASAYILLKYFVPPLNEIGYYLLLGTRAEQYPLSIFLADRLMEEFPEKWTSYIGPAYLYAKMGEKEKGRKYLIKAESFPEFRVDDFVEELRALLK